MKYPISLFRRWAYLLFKGMWRGECGLTLTNSAGLKTMISTVAEDANGIFTHTRVFYARIEAKSAFQLAGYIVSFTHPAARKDVLKLAQEEHPDLYEQALKEMKAMGQ